MKLVTYRATVEAEARLGVLKDDLLIDVEALGDAHGEEMPDTMLDLIDAGSPTLNALREMISDDSVPVNTSLPVSTVILCAPIPRPRKNIWGIGLNYTEHVAESARTLDTSKDLPQKPVLFTKPPTAVIGPNEPILHDSKMTQQLLSLIHI